MILTQAQRFVYGLLVLMFITISALVLLNVYALEFFLILIIIGFLALVELTKPPLVNVGWRKNITIFVAICAVLFLVLFYQRAAMFLR